VEATKVSQCDVSARVLLTGCKGRGEDYNDRSDVYSGVRNLTFAADLSAYGERIMAIFVPELGGFVLVSGVGALAGGWRLRACGQRRENH
jgi:hypothetical protein